MQRIGGVGKGDQPEHGIDEHADGNVCHGVQMIHIPVKSCVSLCPVPPRSAKQAPAEVELQLSSTAEIKILEKMCPRPPV